MCIWAYGHVLMACLRVCVSSTYCILCMMTKRSHTLSIALLLMVCMCTEEIPSPDVSITTADKISINHLRKIPQISAGSAAPGHRNPKNPNRHIYTCSGRHTSRCWDLHSFSPRILTILLQCVRSKSKMARGIWNFATVDLLVIHTIIFGF